MDDTIAKELLLQYFSVYNLLMKVRYGLFGTHFKCAKL